MGHFVLYSELRLEMVVYGKHHGRKKGRWSKILQTVERFRSISALRPSLPMENGSINGFLLRLNGNC
jgi:hypothetical protein